MKLFDDFVAFDEWMLDGPFAHFSKWAMDTVNITPWMLSAYFHIATVVVLVFGRSLFYDIPESRVQQDMFFISIVCFMAVLDVRRALRVNREMTIAPIGTRNKIRLEERVSRCALPGITCLLVGTIVPSDAILFLGFSVLLYVAKYLIAQDMPKPNYQIKSVESSFRAV